MPGATNLATLEALWRQDAAAQLDASARAPVEASATLVQDAAKGASPVYGVNTGLANSRLRVIGGYADGRCSAILSSAIAVV